MMSTYPNHLVDLLNLPRVAAAAAGPSLNGAQNIHILIMSRLVARLPGHRAVLASLENSCFYLMSLDRRLRALSMGG